MVSLLVKIMTDLSLTLAILADGVPSNIFWLTSGIFVLWKISLIQLKSYKYWIATKWPKAMAAQREAFPPQE